MPEKHVYKFASCTSIYTFKVFSFNAHFKGKQLKCAIWKLAQMTECKILSCLYYKVFIFCGLNGVSARF